MEKKAGRKRETQMTKKQKREGTNTKRGEKTRRKLENKKGGGRKNIKQKSR